MPSFNHPTRTGVEAGSNEADIAARLLDRRDLVGFFGRPIYTTNLGGLSQAGGTGGWSEVSGAMEMHAGATSTGFARLAAGFDGTAWPRSLRAGQDWFVSYRARIITTPTTGAVIHTGALDAIGLANYLRLGVDFNSHTTQFCLSGPSGSTMASGVAFDTVIHTFRAWRRQGVSTTFLQVDSNPVVTGNVDILVDSTPVIFVQNGTNANQAQEVVWWSAASVSK